MQPTLAPTRLQTSGLLDWLDDPRPDRGLRFADDDGGWTLWDYPRLADLVAEAAERITCERTRDHGPISIAVPAGPQFVAALLGSLVAGHTPSPLALPVFMRDPGAYARHVAKILEIADPALVVGDPALRAQLTSAMDRAGLRGAPLSLDVTGDRHVAPRRAPRAEAALLQFTSGSSGRPRGVRVSWDNLEANIAQMRDWLGMGPDRSWGSWLPLYHDMGLISALLGPIVTQSDVWIMRPDQFIRRPLRWLELFGRHGVQISVAPNFGYSYAHRRIPEDELAELDFSTWHAAIAAAERLDPAVLTSFARRLEPHGFRRSVLTPAYGLAEGTLAVTGVPPREQARAVSPRWASMQFGEPVTIEREALVGDGEAFGSGAGWLVSCGRPLSEQAVAIVDEDGDELPDGHLGEVRLRGPNVALGYTSDAHGGSTRFTPGGLLTGDAGLICDGDLYVLGRIGDSMKVRGRTVFVEDVEAQVAATEGIGARKAVVLAGADGEGNTIAAVVEARRGAWVEAVARILEAEAGGDANVKVLASPPRTIQLTSSGKPRRRVMWQELVDGHISGEVVFARSNGHADDGEPVLARGMLGPGVEAFRDHVRELIARHVAPHVDAAERERRFPAGVVERLGRTGLLRRRWTGGDHGDAGKAVLLSEELGRAGTGGVGIGVGVHAEAVISILRRFGDSTTLRALCEQALDGRRLGCIATSERAHGSNLAGIETAAEREGDGWRVAGEKRYVSLGAAADFALVLARERDPVTRAPAPGLTLFVVPSSGYRVTARLPSVGNRSLETVTLEIDAHVPGANAVSRSGRGLHAITWGLTHERLATAASTMGIASLALELATVHARRRVQFGAPLIEHQAVRVRLGQLASELLLARAGVYALAGSLDEARADTPRRVAAAKVTVANLGERIVSDCMQVLGGRAYLEDETPLARLWRDVRLARIGGGTDDMMWELVARGLHGSDELYDRFVSADS